MTLMEAILQLREDIAKSDQKLTIKPTRLIISEETLHAMATAWECSYEEVKERVAKWAGL